MASLCPNCGKYLCDCTSVQRCQTIGQFEEDMIREMTPQEQAAWDSGIDSEKIAAARMVAKQRAAGTFVPTFPSKD